MRKQLVWAVALTATVVLVSAPGPAAVSAAASEATELPPFSAVSRADPLLVELIAAGAPVVEGGKVGYLTPVSTQALVDSLGQSQAFASAPYAGDLVTTAPGTANGAAGGDTQVPDFPFYVYSEYPARPDDQFDAGPYHVVASSVRGSSHGVGGAEVGLDPVTFEATSTSDAAVDEDTAVIHASATATVAPTAITDQIVLGEFRAEARVSLDPSDPTGRIERTSSVSLGTTTVAGVPVGITDQGIVVLGNPVPADVDLVEQTLKAADVEFELIPPDETEDSVTSAGLRVTYTTSIPDLGRSTMRLTFGFAYASLSVGAPVVIPATPASAGPVPVTTAPGSAPPDPAMRPPTLPTSTGLPAPDPERVDDVQEIVSPPVSRSVPAPWDVGRLYPILVVGALVSAVTASGTSSRRFRAWLVAS